MRRGLPPGRGVAEQHPGPAMAGGVVFRRGAGPDLVGRVPQGAGGIPVLVMGVLGGVADPMSLFGESQGVPVLVIGVLGDHVLGVSPSPPFPSVSSQ